MATPSLNLRNLNGKNGFVVPGKIQDGYLDNTVNNTGDLNGDGIDDLVIGAVDAGEVSTNAYSYYYSDRHRNNLAPQIGEQDTLIGGAGADRFSLGDRQRIYYDDGNANSSGEIDFAVIRDFNSHFLILSNSYSLG